MINRVHIFLVFRFYIFLLSISFAESISYIFLKAPKHIRMSGTESFGQAGTSISGTIHEAFKSDYSGFEGSNSAIEGEARNGFYWDWDNDERGCMDIQTLLTEFGDFGDFFEGDILPFGEVRIGSIFLNSCFWQMMTFHLTLTFCLHIF